MLAGGLWILKLKVCFRTDFGLYLTVLVASLIMLNPPQGF